MILRSTHPIRRRLKSVCFLGLVLAGCAAAGTAVFAGTPGLTGPCVRNVQSCEAFASIQAAVDDPDTRPGHTLVLLPGTYVENVQVGKAVEIRSLSGSAEDTVVRAADASLPVFTLLADGCALRDVGIRNAASAPGIHVYTARACTVSGCRVALCGCGIQDQAGKENTYTRNELLSNLDLGFLLSDSKGAVLEENLAASNGHDKEGDGFRLEFTEGCTLSGNTARENGGAGFHLHEATGTTLEGNTAKKNIAGALRVERSGDTTFKDNCFQGPEGGLAVEGGTLSARAGGTVHFFLDAGVAHGGARYVLAGSASGTAPGTVLDAGRGLVLPLNMDAFSRLCARAGGAGSASFQGFAGLLDGTGRAEAVLRAKGPLPYGAAGMTFHFAFAAYEEGVGWDFASRAVMVKITP